mgnify:CR=1 FL=1
MGVINIIKETATEVGITAFVTNSDSKIEAQLNRLTDLAELPIALVPWDFTTTVQFDENGFLRNPTTPITMLLLTKVEDRTSDYDEAAAEMGDLFLTFIKALRPKLVPFNRGLSNDNIITSINYDAVPKYGLGKHSGVVGKFTMIGDLSNC